MPCHRMTVAACVTFLAFTHDLPSTSTVWGTEKLA